MTLVQPVLEPPRYEASEASSLTTTSQVARILGTIHPSQSPPLPQPPTNFFGCDMIIEDLLSPVERSASIVLLGAGGIGKTDIALTLLHHTRIMARFGSHRHFVGCDGLANSLVDFLRRLSETIGAPHLTDMGQLLSHLSHSPPCILVLDGIESILDPLTSGAAEISTVIEGLGRCQNACVLATSRLGVRIPGFRRVKVPALSADGAQDIFYSCCLLERSVAVDNLLAELDFHPLSINLLASVVHENDWDEQTLLEAWGNGRTNILKATGRQSLEDSIRLTLGTPTIQALGTTALETLEAIAKLPSGVKESKLESMFTGIAGVGEATDELCKFSLTYRQDGFVKMLSPFRFYFLESGQTLVTRSESDTAGTNTEPPKDIPSGFINRDSVKIGLSPHPIVSRLHDNVRLKRVLHPPANLRKTSVEDPRSKKLRPWGPNLPGKFDPQRKVSTVEVGTLLLVPLIIF